MMPMISSHDLTSATLMDLHITMDDDGNKNIESLTTEETDIASVTNVNALKVLESTIDSGKLLKFTAALPIKRNINDPLFPAWKMYKEKITDQRKCLAKMFYVIIARERLPDSYLYFNKSSKLVVSNVG